VRYLHLCKYRASLVDLTSLSQAGDVNAGPSRQTKPLLKSPAAGDNCFAVAPGEVMRDRNTNIENRILRIMRAHPHRFLQMSDRLVGLAVECKRPAEIAVCGSEIWVEVECAPEFRRRFIGAPLHEGNVAQREMRPWVAVVEFCCPRPEISGTRQLRSRYCRAQIEMTRHQKHEG
jgi:hypothetical protein